MSYATFVQSVADLSITGVTRIYDEPPSTISTADLPASYPRLPEMTREVISLGYTAGLPEHVVELVILVEPVGTDTNAANFAEMVSLIDNANTSVGNAASSIGIDRWSVRQETAVIGESPYWALVVNVEASG